MSIVRTCSPIIARMDSHSVSFSSSHHHAPHFVHSPPFLSPSPSSSSQHLSLPFEEENDNDEQIATDSTNSFSSSSSSNGRGSDSLADLPLVSPSSIPLSAKAKRRCVRRSAVSASVIDADDPDFSMIRQLSFHAVNDLYTKNERIQKLQAYLVHHPLISSLPSDNQQRIFSEMMIEELPHNSIIARKGEIIQKFFVIDDGEIAVHNGNAIMEYKASENEESGMKGIVQTSSKFDYSSSPFVFPSSLLKSGDSIGDLALVHACPSQATYRVHSSRARIFSIDVASFRFLVSSSNRQKYETLKEFFQSSSFSTFSSTLDSTELDALIDASDLKRMRKGESIVTRTASNAPPPSPTRIRSPDDSSPPSSPSHNADDDKKDSPTDPCIVYVVKSGRVRISCYPSCKCHSSKPATLGSVIELMKGGAEEKKDDDNDMNVGEQEDNFASLLSAVGRSTILEADGLFGALPLASNKTSESPSPSSSRSLPHSNASLWPSSSPSSLYSSLNFSTASVHHSDLLSSSRSSPPRSPTLSHQNSFENLSSQFPPPSTNSLSHASPFQNVSPQSSCPSTPSTEKRGLKRNRLDGANNISAMSALAATVSSPQPIRSSSSLLMQPQRPRYHPCHRATCDTESALIIAVDLATIDASIVEKLKRAIL